MGSESLDCEIPKNSLATGNGIIARGLSSWYQLHASHSWLPQSTSDSPAPLLASPIYFYLPCSISGSQPWFASQSCSGPCSLCSRIEMGISWPGLNWLMMMGLQYRDFDFWYWWLRMVHVRSYQASGGTVLLEKYFYNIKLRCCNDRQFSISV